MFKVTVRVVESMCGDRITFTSLCEGTATVLTDITGGATVDAAGIGMWRNANGAMVKELGANVWTLCATAGQVEQVRRAALALKKAGNQDTVMVTVQNVTGEFL